MLEVSRLTDANEYLLTYPIVLFDMDDTLYSEKEYVRSGFEAIASHYPQIPNMADKLWSAFENGEQPINVVLSAEGFLTPENVTDCLQIYRSHLPHISLYSDAVEVLCSLRAQGIPLGLITDGRPEGQRNKIEALGIEPYFDKIIITDELGGEKYRKPHTKAFTEMQRFFNVPFQDMVYIGDNIRKDFIAPQELGMGSVYFNNPEGLYSAKR